MKTKCFKIIFKICAFLLFTPVISAHNNPDFCSEKNKVETCLSDQFNINDSNRIPKKSDNYWVKAPQSLKSGSIYNIEFYAGGSTEGNFVIIFLQYKNPINGKTVKLKIIDAFNSGSYGLNVPHGINDPEAKIIIEPSYGRGGVRWKNINDNSWSISAPVSITSNYLWNVPKRSKAGEKRTLYLEPYLYPKDIIETITVALQYDGTTGETYKKLDYEYNIRRHSIEITIPEGIVTNKAIILIQYRIGPTTGTFTIKNTTPFFIERENNINHIETPKNWIAGSEQEINWIFEKGSGKNGGFTGIPKNVRIEFSYTNIYGEFETQEIAYSTPNDGKFLFNVPPRINTKDAVLRIIELPSRVVDLISEEFTIKSPIITPIKWYGGSFQNIKWSAFNGRDVNVKIQLRYTDKSGESVTRDIVYGTPDDGAYGFRVPLGIKTNNATLIITESQGNDHMIIHHSESFTITPNIGFIIKGIPPNKVLTPDENNEISFQFQYIAKPGFTNTTFFSIKGLPEGAIAQFSPRGKTKKTEKITVTIKNVPKTGFQDFASSIVAKSGYRSVIKPFKYSANVLQQRKALNKGATEKGATEIDFISINPNPNNGSFNIMANKLKSKGLIAEVYDTSGRLVLKKSFSAYDDFNETINLENAKSGLYILVLNDGVNKTTKKIIVE